MLLEAASCFKQTIGGFEAQFLILRVEAINTRL